MFGYINVNSKELSEKDRQIYQSYYCGLCQKLKADCGRKGQMLLNYDMTFLIVLLTGLYEPKDSKKRFTCALHPAKKRASRYNAITEYAAAMNVILAYHNMLDDWEDEKNLPKLAMAGMMKKDYAAIAAKYPRQVSAVETCIRELHACEKRGEDNIDLVSGVMGTMLGELFDWKQDEWSNELKTLGFYMGKYVYLMDAYEDLDSDIKKGLYNPLIKLKQQNEKDYECLCKLLLTSIMSECAKSFERLPILLHADIIRNILYSGVWSKYEYIQLKKKKRNKK